MPARRRATPPARDRRGRPATGNAETPAPPVAATDDVKILPVDASRWTDLETLFRSVGILRNCWCMLWRMTREERKQNDPASRRRFMRRRVRAGTPVGLLAYAGGEPVAWCSIAPRDTYQRLGGDESLEDVWSLACFFVRREHRGRGVTRLLLEHAKAYAKRNGARVLEAYPVEPGSPSYRFMGFVPSFERAGFEHVKRAGSRRHVMTCRL